MTAAEDEARETAAAAGDGRGPLFSWGFYLFGMAMTAPVFALIMQFVIRPGWGERLLRGWIDPSLNLLVIPLIGAVIGFFLVATANVISVVSRKRSRPSG